jgi:phosphatidylglycerol:prolipoprotein diacylglycerol transferase
LIPYFEIPAWRIGPFQIHVFGFLVATALAVSYFSLRRRLRQLGEDTARVPGMIFWILAGSAAGALLLKFITTRGADPAELLRLTGGGAAYGGLVAGLAGGWLYLRVSGVRGARLVLYLDALAFVLPRGWLFLRLGCALVHDHPGVRTDSWLGVQYPGGTRFDLGLLELLFTVACLAILSLLDIAQRPLGFYSGFLPFAYGVCRLTLEPLREDPVRYLGWTVNQYFSSVAVVVGLAVLAVSVRRAPTKGLPLPGR